MKKLSIAAQTAKAIKKELRREFPNTKFSVKSETFAFGNAVNVCWTDGPTKPQVEEIIDKYQYGYFDGMTDGYVYNNKREGIPQVKYVNIPCRRRSLEAEQTILNQLRVDKPGCFGKNRHDFVEEQGIEMLNLIKFRFEKTAF